MVHMEWNGMVWDRVAFKEERLQKDMTGWYGTECIRMKFGEFKVE